LYEVRKIFEFKKRKYLFNFGFFSLEYANNLGSTKKTNGVDHTTTDGTSNGNTEDSHKQYLLDLLEKF
jgi:hypothetical protein